MNVSDFDLLVGGAVGCIPDPPKPIWIEGRRNRRDLRWADYVALVHADDTRGVVAFTYSARVTGRDGAETFRTKVAGATGAEMRETVQRLRPWSFTMSAFRPAKDGSHWTRPCKATWNLSSLGALWVDLDFYRLAAYRYATPESMVQTVLDRCYDLHLPWPSFILQSGRGVLAVWTHERQRPAVHPIWTHMQRRLNDVFADMGRDVVAMPCTASFRIAGTRNRDASVEVLWPEWADQIDRHDFQVLREHLLPYTLAQVAEYKKTKERNAAAKAAAKVQGKATARPRLTRETYSRAVLRDLMRLFEHRHRGLPVPVGERDLWLYSLTVASAWTMTPDALEAEVDRLAPLCGMSLRLARAQMRTVVSKAQKAGRGELSTHRRRRVDPRYRSNPKTLMASFGITPDEVTRLDLRVLVPRAIRQAREAERSQQRRRQAGAKDRTILQAERLTLGNRALEERAVGKKVSEIAFEADVSISHVEKAMREARAVRAIGKSVAPSKNGHPRKTRATGRNFSEQTRQTLVEAIGENPLGPTEPVKADASIQTTNGAVVACEVEAYDHAVHSPAPQDDGQNACWVSDLAGVPISDLAMPAFLVELLGWATPEGP